MNAAPTTDRLRQKQEPHPPALLKLSPLSCYAILLHSIERGIHAEVPCNNAWEECSCQHQPISGIFTQAFCSLLVSPLSSWRPYSGICLHRIKERRKNSRPTSVARHPLARLGCSIRLASTSLLSCLWLLMWISCLSLHGPLSLNNLVSLASSKFSSSLLY